MKVRDAKTISDRELQVKMNCEVARMIRQHASESLKAEVCGVLIGVAENGVTRIDAAIPGANAEQGGAHVTFTQDTWEHIYRIKDRDYPEARIVGWYHSHPGFGVFLSDHDTFIHNNFFSAIEQVAWVYDPHSDEEGCFGWCNTSLRRLSTIVLIDEKAGELAGATGKPEPQFLDASDDFQRTPSSAFPEREGTKALRLAGTLFTYLTILLIGMLLSWIFLPHIVWVDVRTGEPIINLPEALPDGNNHGTKSKDSENRRSQPNTSPSTESAPKVPTQNSQPVQSAPSSSGTSVQPKQSITAPKGTP